MTIKYNKKIIIRKNLKGNKKYLSLLNKYIKIKNLLQIFYAYLNKITSHYKKTNKINRNHKRILTKTIYLYTL